MSSRRVKYYCWPGQAEILQDIKTPELAVVSGNGYGKTTLGVRKYYNLCIHNKHCKYSLIAAPSVDILKTVTLPAFQEFFEHLGWDEGREYKINRSQSTLNLVLLWNPVHTILLRTFHRGAVRLRVGVTVSHAWVDEPGLCGRQVSTEVAKRTRDPKAKVRQRLYTGTPEGTNWFAEKFDGLERAGRYSMGEGRKVLHGSTYDNPVLDPDYIAELEREFAWNPNLRRAYIEGEFVPIYEFRGFDFERKKHVEPQETLADRPLYLAWDFNVTTGRAGGVSWVVNQEHGLDIYSTAENKTGMRTTFEACDDFIRQFPPEKWGKCELLITGDAAGRQRDTKQYGDDYDIIRQKLRPLYPLLRIIAPYANPSVAMRLATCNRLFSDDYHATWYIDPGCTKLIASLTQTTIDEKGNVEKPPGEVHTHHAEAAGYSIVQLRPLKKPEPRRGHDFLWA